MTSATSVTVDVEAMAQPTKVPTVIEAHKITTAGSTVIEAHKITTAGSTVIEGDKMTTAGMSRKIAMAVAICALLVVGMGLGFGLTMGLAAQQPSAVTLSTNISVELFKHPELLVPPDNSTEVHGQPEAWGVHGTNACNFWHKANPLAVAFANAYPGLNLNKVIDTCSSSCEMLDYSIPSGLMKSVPSGSTLTWKEKHIGWGSFVCGSGNNNYGIYRGGSQCAATCCTKVINYCKSALWAGSLYECTGQRGCFPYGGSTRH